MKAAVIGLGAISKLHINALKLRGIDIVALCDSVKERAEEAIKEFNLNAKIYSDYKDLLDNESLDVVHICTPHFLHAPISVYALGKNVNVLCEKPIAISEEQLSDIEAAVKKSKAVFGVCQQNRYNPSVLYAKKYLEGKNLISAAGTLVWKRDADYYHSGDWRGKKATEGGGVMINQALHTLDILQWFMGMPDSVIANVSDNSLRGIIEVEDTAFGLFKYKDSPNKDFIINATNAAKYSFPVNISVSDGEHTVVIVGDNLIIDDKFVETEKGQPVFGKEVWGTGHINLIKDYYDCLERHKPFALDFYEARKVVKLILAMYGSDGAEKEIK